MALKVPRPARPVREEGGQLPWAHTTRMYAPMVQALPPADSFGIVTKGFELRRDSHFARAMIADRLR